ncbi:MAG: S-adenosylmethionine:tRNA ribosyltransferase-isomerase, partial [Saprospiraceae bacterium]|nr:S-adenosylmethionine:tRNA ribosyltransferase-isomerase [Saprospiraceae bacterium]
MILTTDTIRFRLPDQLACPEPTEQRNISRDAVRLLISRDSGKIVHSHFRNLPEYLSPNDVLVINTSATLPSAFPIELPGEKKGMVHLSTPISDREWLVEIREIRDDRTIRWTEGKKEMVFQLPANSFLKLKGKFYRDRELLHLWVGALELSENMQSYMARYGRPIKYVNLSKSYPIDFYQTFFSFHPGSAEMPSAGRGFTKSLVNKLMQKGIIFAPILLHTGVSSLEENEPPYPEYFEIDPISAAIINKAKRDGNRVIAVGTTAVRALESATDEMGNVISYKGNSNLYITGDYSMKTVDGLLTGFH